MGRQLGESALHIVAPAALEAASQGVHAGDDQPVAGAGEGDVEQAQGFVVRGDLASAPRLG